MLEIKDTLLGDRIRRVRRNRGLTQGAFAKSLGIAQGYLSSIECGNKVPSDTLLIALSQLYQIDENWLAAGGGEVKPGTIAQRDFPPALSAANTPLLRRIPQNFPDGISEEHILEHCFLPGSPVGCYAITAYGDFMAPTIQDGDLVIFRPGRDAGQGNIVLVTSKWGDTLLRRFRIVADGVFLSPDNSLYKAFPLESVERLIGVVVDVWRRVKL